MSNALKLFTMESTDIRDGRCFTIRLYAFKGVESHFNPWLYDTQNEAQAIVDEAIESGHWDNDEIIITPIMLHSDGTIFDEAGNELLPGISKQTKQSQECVREGLAMIYSENERRLRHAAEATSEGPGL